MLVISSSNSKKNHQENIYVVYDTQQVQCQLPYVPYFI